jgi:formylglycine-generating enzyme required for sulfatase activity
MTLVLLPAGTFRMGSNNGDGDEKPLREVRIRQAFYLGQYEVTQGQ